MKITTCSYCGTEYDTKSSCCPHCGSVNEQGTARGKNTGNRSDADRSPRGLWAAICCVLGLAVLIGLIAFILQMGYFREGFDLNAIPTNLEQTQPPQEAEVYPETEEAEDKACTDLTISQNEIRLRNINAKNFLTAVASPSDCEDEIVFVSSDESVVLVDDKGVISAVGPGRAEIIVTCGDITEICDIFCDFEMPEEEEETEQADEPGEPEEEETDDTTEIALPAPEVIPADFTLRTPGEEAYLMVNNVPDGAVVTFASNNPNVVSVTSEGKVRAESDGQTTIVIMVDDVRLESIARCNLNSTTEGGTATENAGTYTGPFALSHTDVTFSFAGESFVITLTDAAGKAVSGLAWTTGNSGVCTVSGSTVKAVGGGQTTLTATYNGTTYSCIVRCNF